MEKSVAAVRRACVYVCVRVCVNVGVYVCVCGREYNPGPAIARPWTDPWHLCAGPVCVCVCVCAACVCVCVRPVCVCVCVCVRCVQGLYTQECSIAPFSPVHVYMPKHIHT